MKYKTSDKVASQVLEKYCGEKSFHTVKVLKDREGKIGGYVLQPAIGDSPISYLDCDGNFLVSFHIFGSEDEKKKANEIIFSLREQFPVEEPLTDCHV